MWTYTQSKYTLRTQWKFWVYIPYCTLTFYLVFLSNRYISTNKDNLQGITGEIEKINIVLRRDGRTGQCDPFEDGVNETD